MNTAQDVEQELKDTQYPHLRVMRGGKGPPEATSEDWLTPLEQYSTFVCRQNPGTLDGELYYLAFKGEQFFLLRWCLPDGKIWDRYVNPQAFCKHYREHEVLGVNPPPEVEAKNPPPRVENENDQRQCNSHRPDDLVRDAPVSGEHQVDEEEG